MGVPSPRTPVRIARGTKSVLTTNKASLEEGEICYATDENKVYVKEGSNLEDVGPTILDEDDMATDSATAVPSQQSVKAYAQPLDADLTSLSGCQTGAAAALAALTSTEVEVLDGVTATTAELNKLDGFTGTHTDLNYIDVATAGTAEASKAVVLDASKDITGLNDVTIAGNLTVNGTTTTIDTTNLTVEDPLISLAKNNNSANTVDIGFYGLYDATGSQDVYTGLFRDANDSGKWKLFELNQAAPTTTVDVSGTGYTAATLVVGTLEDSKGDVRNIPQNTQGSTYTLVAADAGKHILASGTITVPNSVFSAGDAVTIVNNTSGNLTITKTITTMYLGTDATSTNRTLAQRGIATILFVSGTVAYISGAGLS